MDPPKPEPSPGLPRQVVYVPSCVTRMMGPARSDSETASVHEKLLSLFAKAGYEVIYPEVGPPALPGSALPHPTSSSSQVDSQYTFTADNGTRDL